MKSKVKVIFTVGLFLSLFLIGICSTPAITSAVGGGPSPLSVEQTHIYIGVTYGGGHEVWVEIYHQTRYGSYVGTYVKLMWIPYGFLLLGTSIDRVGHSYVNSDSPTHTYSSSVHVKWPGVYWLSPRYVLSDGDEIRGHISTGDFLGPTISLTHDSGDITVDV